MSKISYDSAFSIIKSQMDACAKLDESGFKFEYDDTPVGKFMLGLIRQSEAIIIDSLGLHEVSHNINCMINGTPYPTTLEVLYTYENDDKWSITMDDFYDFIYKATQDTITRDLMWESMVNRSEKAKEEFNTIEHGKIGAIVKYLQKNT